MPATDSRRVLPGNLEPAQLTKQPFKGRLPFLLIRSNILERKTRQSIAARDKSRFANYPNTCTAKLLDQRRQICHPVNSSQKRESH